MFSRILTLYGTSPKGKIKIKKMTIGSLLEYKKTLLEYKKNHRLGFEEVQGINEQITQLSLKIVDYLDIAPLSEALIVGEVGKKIIKLDLNTII